jgi:hypothetical protein
MTTLPLFSALELIRVQAAPRVRFMQLQNLQFPGFGYNPWGTGTPGAANPASPGGSAGSGTGAGGTATGNSSTAGGTSSASGNSSTGSSSSAAGASPSTIGSELSSAVSDALSSFGGTAGNGLTTSVSELAVVRESETLKIKMTDGAQITISLGAQGAAFGTAQTQADGSSSVAAGVFSSGQLQVSVKGNLSSADMQAVSDVVSQVNSLATQFFSGDVQDAFAAAANLSVDPTEIAGFSLKLSYSSTLIQQASASGPASGTTAPGSTGVTPPGSTSASQPSATPDPTAASTATSAGPADASTASSAANTSSAAGTNTLSPQQIIINFVQKVMSTLGRSSINSHSHLAASSRWKLHLLAQALPAYTQAQAAGAASGGMAGGAPGAASSGAVAQGPASQAAPSQGITPAAGAQPATYPAASAPQTATNRYPTLQAAKLAADTFSQLAQ